MLRMGLDDSLGSLIEITVIDHFLEVKRMVAIAIIYRHRPFSVITIVVAIISSSSLYW